MKLIDTYLLGIGPTPKDIKRMRQEVLDFHLKLGQPVIYKHRWNLRDLQEGRAQRCPDFDESYHRDKTDCKKCFGTSFLGGYDDGIVLFATISDAPVDELKIGPQGYILFDRHPQFTAPWFPDMGDGDLIIQAEFDLSTWSVLQTSDRFELNDVQPVTIRGLWGAWSDFKLYKVQQTAQIDRLPFGHVYYNIPIEFDYVGELLIAPIIPPLGEDPDLFPIAPKIFASTHQPFKLIGQDGFFTAFDPIGFRLIGGGTTTQQTFKFKLKGGVSAVGIFEDTLVENIKTTFIFKVEA